jgi:hypothetical protein
LNPGETWRKINRRDGNLGNFLGQKLRDTLVDKKQEINGFRGTNASPLVSLPAGVLGFGGLEWGCVG